MAFPPVPDSSTGAIDQGPAPIYTPDQLRRLRLSLSRSPFYVEQDYFLRIFVVNAVVGQTVQISIRFEDLQGNRKPLNQSFTPGSVRGVDLFTLPLSEGLMFGISLACTGVSADLGTCYVMVTLNQGNNAAPTLLQTLIAGWCTSTQIVSWPYAGNPVTDRPGVYRVIQLTTPPAGTDFTQIVPTGARWRLLSFRAKLVTDNTNGTRLAALEINDGGTNVISTIPAAATTPVNSSGQFHTWGQGLTNQAISSIFYATSESNELEMQGGFGIVTHTLNIQPGDQWSSGVMLVRETVRIQ